MTEQYEVAVSGDVYRVVHEDNEGVRRICVQSGGQFRFSLPGDTPDEQVRTSSRCMPSVLVDGQSARPPTVEDRMPRAAQCSGKAAWPCHWQAEGGAPVTLP